MRIDSGSRISPITRMSGAWRTAARRAVGKSGASTPTSTCSITPGMMRVLVLDRILDGDDVARVASIDRVDQRRQGRGLAGSGRAADQHQPAARRDSRSTSGGRFSSASVGTRAGSTRIAAAARPRSWCRLTRKRPSAGSRSDASAMPVLELPRRVRGQHRHDQRLRCLRRRAPRRRSATAGRRRGPTGGTAGHQQQVAALAPHHFRQPLFDAAGCRRAGAHRRRGGVQLADQGVEIVGRHASRSSLRDRRLL